MSVKSLYSRKQLLVVSQGDENLGMVADSLLQHRQRSLADLVFF
jgi:hypothetical protein